MDTRTTARRTLVILVILGGVALAFQLRGLLGLTFTAFVLASAIRPRVESLRHRGLPHGVAVAGVYVVLATSLIALLMMVVPTVLALVVDVVRQDLLGRQLRVFLAELTLMGWKRFAFVIPVLRLPTHLQHLVEQAGSNAGRDAIPLTLAMLRGVGNFGLVLILAYYWLLARDPTLRLVFRIVPPSGRRGALLLWRDVEQRLGSWMRGQLILMTLMGLAVFVGLLLLGIPYALPLAVIAGLLQIVPMLGPILSIIPTALVALTVSASHALFVIGYLLFLQQIDNAYVTPRVMHDATGLNPLLVILAVVAGGMLGGIPGALLGVPVGAVAQAILEHTYFGEEDRSTSDEAPAGVPPDGALEAKAAAPG